MEGVGERNETRRGTMPPTWSPDGKQLAFQYKKDESFDIWTIPAEGGIPTQMTGDPHWEKSPVWAPDGKSIVFNRKRELTDQAGPWDIWVVPAEGGEPEKIVDEAYTQLGFSPDGKWLAFHRKGVWEAVSVLHLGDRREFTIGRPEEVGDFTRAAWSPEGNKLLFYNSGFEYWETLGVVSVYGGPMELGKGVRLSTYAQKWSPDGKFILTLDWEADGIWVIPTDGGLSPAMIEVETEPEIWRYALQPFSPDAK